MTTNMPGDDDDLPAAGDDCSGLATPAAGNTMTVAEHAAFSAAIADSENATVEFCAAGNIEILALSIFSTLT